ncbi:MAG: hypothetical protein ABFS05_13240 [Bacteroidota bacterium]
MKIQKGILSVIIFLLASMMSLSAQNSMVSSAIQAFHDGDYESAYQIAGDALANIDELSGDYIPAAYYYLAKSRIQVLRLALESGDQEKYSGMQNALIESYYDYKEALKTADAKLKSDIEQDLSTLYNPILQTGLSALNTSKDKQQPHNIQQSALQAALGYLKAAKDISATYLICDLLGQTYIAMGDSLQALALMDESITAYRSNPPVPPDFLMAYVYFRKAMIERYYLLESRKALATLMEGQNLLHHEYSKPRATALTAEDRLVYDNGLIDLIGFELDIYLHDTLLIDDAIIRFQEILVMYPEDYDIHVSYANLLEEIDVNLAIDAYETAISIDDSKELAYFNLGALYNNLGSELYLRGLNTDDDHRADSLYNEANDYFRTAYINMESAYNINPKLLPCIRALVQLSKTLGLDERADYYRQKEMELRGF